MIFFTSTSAFSLLAKHVQPLDDSSCTRPGASVTHSSDHESWTAARGPACRPVHRLNPRVYVKVVDPIVTVDSAAK